uniref:Uncharacterized protein n=1 Tax=Anguilla anguilla TaxID=7936 RepID=A0A0E9W4Y6_ANGAN
MYETEVSMENSCLRDTFNTVRLRNPLLAQKLMLSHSFCRIRRLLRRKTFFPFCGR